MGGLAKIGYEGEDATLKHWIVYLLLNVSI